VLFEVCCCVLSQPMFDIKVVSPISAIEKCLRIEFGISDEGGIGDEGVFFMLFVSNGIFRVLDFKT